MYDLKHEEISKSWMSILNHRSLDQGEKPIVSPLSAWSPHPFSFILDSLFYQIFVNLVLLVSPTIERALGLF